MTGYEKLKAQAAAIKRGRGQYSVPAAVKRIKTRLLVDERYGKLTIDEMEHLRDKAENWMKENMNNPNFDEANRRYMAIEDLIQEKCAEELFKQ